MSKWEIERSTVTRADTAVRTENGLIECYSVKDARLITVAPKLFALVKKLADAPLPLGDDFNDLDDSDVLDARAIVEAVEGV